MRNVGRDIRGEGPQGKGEQAAQYKIDGDHPANNAYDAGRVAPPAIHRNILHRSITESRLQNIATVDRRAGKHPHAELGCAQMMQQIRRRKQ
jgi:hypothetical protein